MFLSRLSLKNPVFIIMMTIAIIIFGLMGYRSLGTDMFPNVDIPVITIVAVYPGADSKTIENDVVKKIEDTVATISSIKHLDGYAFSNAGQVVIQFEDGVDINIAAQDIRGKLAAIQNDLPQDMEPPVVEKLDLDAVPVISVALEAPAGDKLSHSTDIAEKFIKKRLQTVHGVGSVNMYGGRKREIQILMNPLRISSLNISAMGLIQIMKSNFMEIPAGTLKLKDNSEEIVLKSSSEALSLEEIRKTPLFSSNGNTLKVEDIADVKDGLEEEESASFLGLNPTIALQVQKQSGVNVVKMAKEVRKELETIGKLLPEGYKVTIVSDNSPFIEKAIGSSTEDIFLGSLLAVLIIFFFLRNIRASIIIAIALPTSIIGTFLFIKAMGYTLNYMTTLALSLSVGLLVDDAIVIIENIFRHIEMGKDRLKASIEATAEIGLAVVAVTLTIVAVFGPIVYMKGMIGQFFTEFGFTVSVAVLISLVVSFTITPLMASKMLKEENKSFFIYRIIEKMLIGLENGYAAGIRLVLHNFWSELLTILIAFALFFLGIYFAAHTRSNFMDQIDQGEFDINIELPGESSLDLGKTVSNRITTALSQFNWYDLTFSTIGGGAGKEKNKMTIRVKLTPLRERKATQFEAMDNVRDSLSFLKTDYNATFSVTEKSDVGGQDTNPVQIIIMGSDYDLVKLDAEKIIDFMHKDGNYTDILTSDKGVKKEVLIKFNQERMSELGVNPAETSMTLRYLFTGEKVAEYKEKGEMYDIKVHIDPGYKNLDSIKSIPLKMVDNQMIKISDVASITYSISDSIISRKSRNRMIRITSGLKPGSDLGKEVEKIKSFTDANFEKGNELAFSGEVEMMKDTQESMGQTFVIALFLIYILLASQFNSFIHPLTIMSAIPFALTGAFATLYGLDQSLSLMSTIGLIMLVGLVVKNSILLVDFTLHKLGKGISTKEALIEAGRIRLRPILMTSLATIFGMIPVALATGEGSEIKHPMAWSVIGGMLFSTMITLFIVPVIFNAFDKLTIRKKEAQI